jgi:hypothetical protein
MSIILKAVGRPRRKSIKQIDVLVAIVALLMLGFVGLVGIGVRNARQWLPLRDTHAANSTPTAASTVGRALGGKTEPKRTGDPNKRGLDEADQAVEFKELPAFCGGGEMASATLCCQIACGGAPSEADSSTSKTDVVVSPVFPTPDDFPPGATGVQIRAQFGEPTARVIETRDGSVFELYYYFSPDRTQLTVARLKAGVIVSAENTVP